MVSGFEKAFTGRMFELSLEAWEGKRGRRALWGGQSI